MVLEISIAPASPLHCVIYFSRLLWLSGMVTIRKEFNLTAGVAK